MIRVMQCETSSQVKEALALFNGYPMDMNIGGPSADRMSANWAVIYEKGYNPDWEPDKERPVVAVILLAGDGLLE